MKDNCVISESEPFIGISTASHSAQLDSEKKPDKKGAVVSDLHLFTNRTTVHEHMPAIREAAKTCQLFVFNGDIFDFQWSMYEGFDASAQAAYEWIEEIVSAHPGTKFIFLLGNHDSIPEYTRMLDRLSKEFPNLEWYPHWYRLGTKVFLHGDVWHAGKSKAKLEKYRLRCNRTLQHSHLQHMCYLLFARSGLPAFFLRFVRKKTCARRMYEYLANEMGPALIAVNEVFFGHVHTAFSDFRYKEIIFHNTGAALKGLRLSVIIFDF